MVDEPNQARAFRDRLKRLRRARPDQWESSRRLLSDSTMATTVTRLADAIRGSNLPDAIRQSLLASLLAHGNQSVAVSAHSTLSELTGLPPSKALRALCLEFGLLDESADDDPDRDWTPERLEDFLRRHHNPYDLLRDVQQPSLLDLGAGDLSFLAEVAEAYRPASLAGTPDLPALTLHGVDRIRPGSRLGVRYQPAPAHLARLSGGLAAGLRFKYWGDHDLCALDRLGRQVLSRYTIVTCHAPASPTFAYEPSRLSPAAIEAHLRATRGPSQRVREGDEEALAVQEGGRSLMFPPWKFEIRGPVALLNVVAQRGRIGILSCVDGDVFWEVLAQLVEVPALHSCSTVFTPAILSRHLGALSQRLLQLAREDRLMLGEHIELRKALPTPASPSHPPLSSSLRFRYIEVRRGAFFPNMPASQTARLFPQLTAETTPWMLTLVPDGPARLG